MSRPRIAVCGWIGSTNLGDELIAEQVATMIVDAGGDPSFVTIDPEVGPAGFPRIRHGGALDTIGLVGALRRHDGIVFGGGGLIQDETGPLNLPFHLTRLGVGRALRRPWAAIALGVGDVRRRSGRLLVKTVARGFVGASVRDVASADRFLSLTGVRPELGLDPVLDQPAREVDATDHVVVSLRPINSPTQRRLTDQTGPAAEQVATWASAIDAIADETGLGVRFVSWDDTYDHDIHERVAAHLRVPVELERPQVGDVIDRVGSGRLVVTMRYHGAVAAIVTGRRALLLDYSPKMASLAEEAGAGLRCVPPTAPADDISSAAVALLGEPAPTGVGDAAERADVNRRVISDLVAAASAR